MNLRPLLGAAMLLALAGTILWSERLTVREPVAHRTTFMGTWNDFLGPLIYLNDQEAFTLSLGLQAYQSQHGGTPWNLLMAAATVVIAPVLLVFFFAQRVFIQGIDRHQRHQRVVPIREPARPSRSTGRVRAVTAVLTEPGEQQGSLSQERPPAGRLSFRVHRLRTRAPRGRSAPAKSPLLDTALGAPEARWRDAEHVSPCLPESGGSNGAGRAIACSIPGCPLLTSHSAGNVPLRRP